MKISLSLEKCKGTVVWILGHIRTYMLITVLSIWSSINSRIVILLFLFGFIYFRSCLGGQIAEARWVNSPANAFDKILTHSISIFG